MMSGEFRKSYAKLTAPVIVTVLGRPIGTWIPTGTENQIIVTNAIDTPMKGLTVDNGAPKPPATFNDLPRLLHDHFATKPSPSVHVAPLPAPRPFTPAPKPGKR